MTLRRLLRPISILVGLVFASSACSQQTGSERLGSVSATPGPARSDEASQITDWDIERAGSNLVLIARSESNVVGEIAIGPNGADRFLVSVDRFGSFEISRSDGNVVDGGDELEAGAAPLLEALLEDGLASLAQSERDANDFEDNTPLEMPLPATGECALSAGRAALCGGWVATLALAAGTLGRHVSQSRGRGAIVGLAAGGGLAALVKYLDKQTLGGLCGNIAALLGGQRPCTIPLNVGVSRDAVEGKDILFVSASPEDSDAIAERVPARVALVSYSCSDRGPCGAYQHASWTVALDGTEHQFELSVDGNTTYEIIVTHPVFRGRRLVLPANGGGAVAAGQSR